MSESDTKKRGAGIAGAVLAALLLLVAAPLIAACCVTIYVLARFRGLRPGGYPPDPGNLARRPGVKTMSEVMEKLGRIRFGRSRSRFLATAEALLLETVPTVMNTNRVTSGLVYPYPLSFEPVMIESQDGTPVCGLLGLQPGDAGRPGLVIVHGLFGCKNQFMPMSLALKAYYRWGFNVFVLDLRNFGDSGRFSEAPTSWGFRESDDILAAADYLESIDCVSTVGVCGVSMGAASALIAASRSRLDTPLSGGVVALNGYGDVFNAIDYISGDRSRDPEELSVSLFFRLMMYMKTLMSGPRAISDFREYTRQVAGQYYEIGAEELMRKASPVNVMREIEVPCLIIHAEDDTIVPPSEAALLIEAAADNPMVDSLVVPGGSHALYQLTNRRWFYETLETFFSYWAEFGSGGDSAQDGIDSIDMFGNPNN